MLYSLALSTVQILSKNLRSLRQRRGLTQVQVAEAAALDYKHYQRLEGSDWPGVRLDTVDRLAEALRVPTWELLRPPPDETKMHQTPESK